MYNEENNFDFSLKPNEKQNVEISKNDGKPLISIITAYYNVKDLIEETAVCVFNQTLPYWEWIIVNDGSTEKGTVDFLNNFAKQDSRIKVFHKENEGLPKTRDYAISKSTTELLYILDPDDLFEPTFLEAGYWSLKTNPEATWVYSNHVGFQNVEYTSSVPFDLNTEKRENVICGNSIVKKKELLEVGGYSKADRGVYEDWHLWLRLLSKGYFPIRMNYYAFWYRRRDGVLNSINKDNKKKQIAMRTINKLAQNIKIRELKAIQFPIKTDINELLLPKPFLWDRKPIYLKNKKKKQLLFILPWLVVGGADKFNLELISKLDKSEFNITIITTEYSKYVLRQEFEKHATIFDLSTFLKQKDWAPFIDYIIKSRNIDLVFLSNSFYGYYALPWLKSMNKEVKFVDYLHAEDFSWRHGAYPRDSNAISNILDKTFTCTNHLKNVMFEKMDRKNENVKTIYIGVDEKKFDPKNEEIEKVDFSYYNNKKIILFSCRIVELKRPIFVLEVLKEILTRRKDVVLFVVGDGEQLREMKAKARVEKLLDNVVFFGMKSDVRPYYKRADVLIIPSLTEGLTLSAYEAMSMELPVVSADVGGQSELINNNCGKIIKTYQTIEKDLFNRNYSKEEIHEYAKAIEEVMYSKKYITISTNCRKTILETFTIDKMINNLSKEFIDIIETKSKNNFNDVELSQNYLSMFIQKNPIFVSHFEDSKKKVYKIIKKNGKLESFLWKLPFWRKTVELRNSMRWKSKALKNKVKWESYAIFNRIKWFFKQGPKEFLWKFSVWRKFISFCRKSGIIKIKKKILRK